MRTVSRRGKHFTVQELAQIAVTLAEMTRLKWKLLEQINGRVLVRWIDPLCTAGHAHDFYEKLRSALDEEWLDVTCGRTPLHENPFYGDVWKAIERRGQEELDAARAERGSR